MPAPDLTDKELLDLLTEIAECASHLKAAKSAPIAIDIEALESSLFEAVGRWEAWQDFTAGEAI